MLYNASHSYVVLMYATIVIARYLYIKSCVYFDNQMDSGLNVACVISELFLAGFGGYLLFMANNLFYNLPLTMDFSTPRIRLCRSFVFYFL